MPNEDFMTDIIFSVIIPTYNRRDILKRTLNCIAMQTFSLRDYEIIVIDDGSEDGTAEFLKKYNCNNYFKYLVNETNMGRAVTRNKGIVAARGSYVLMIDDDIWAEPGLIAEHYRTHKEHSSDIGVVGAIHISPEVPNTAVNMYLNRHHLWCLSEMRKSANDLPYSFCKTANLSFKKDLLLKVGLFNETFKTYGGEDSELGFRINQECIKFIFAPNAVGKHYHDESLDGFIKKEEERTRSFELYKHLYPKEKLFNNESFFTPHFNKGLSFKKIIFNFIKAIIFNKFLLNVNKTFIKINNKNIFIQKYLIAILLPVLKIQTHNYYFKRKIV